MLQHITLSTPLQSNLVQYWSCLQGQLFANVFVLT